VSGICGICELNRDIPRANVEPMVSALTSASESSRSVMPGRSFAAGVARRWDTQDTASVAHIRIAIDVDLLNVADLAQYLKAHDTSAPQSSVAELLASLYILRGPAFL